MGGPFSPFLLQSAAAPEGGGSDMRGSLAGALVRWCAVTAKRHILGRGPRGF